VRRPSFDERDSYGRVAVVGAAAAFIAALALESRAESSFAIHMVQHLILIVVVAPLLVIAIRPRRRVPMLVTWLAFGVVMWVTHLTSLYDTALDHALTHALEHLVFVGAGFLFWMPLVTGDRPYPLRLAYLALALPQQAFLALAIYSSSSPIYEHYSSLDDQKAGAIVMWVGGDMAFIIAIAIVVAAWMRSERADEGAVQI
jgi:putative membrane protein